jgi:putative N6-adenine-specific DNA methylase
VKFFATAGQGTEPFLADELHELGLERVKPTRAGVSFSGRWEDAWRACLWSRIAVRILLPLTEYPCRGPADLYSGARRVEWGEHISPRTTIAVSAVGSAPGLDNTMFIAQKVKDAVVDRLRDETGARPSVDRTDPDVALFARIGGGRASLYLDLSGDPLHKRGYRAKGARAPLKETLAAALVRASGWDRVRPLVDPLCGSGTVAIEADHLARRVAPGLSRRRFGFERWASFDEGLARRLAALRERARSEQLTRGPLVLASDMDPKAVEVARDNVARANAQVRVERQRLGEKPIPEASFVVSNPPHGERLPVDPRLFEELTRAAAGSSIALLIGPETPLSIPKNARVFKVKNGAIPCRFVVFGP